MSDLPEVKKTMCSLHRRHALQHVALQIEAMQTGAVFHDIPGTGALISQPDGM